MNEITWLSHYGVGPDDNPPGRGSGRYPKGSGENPRNGRGGTFKFFRKKNEKKENKKSISLNRGPSKEIYNAIKKANPKKVNDIVRNLIKNKKMISEEQIKKLRSLDDEWFDLETKSEDLYNDLRIKYSKDVDAKMKKDGIDPEDRHRGYWEDDIINKDPEMVKINNKAAEAYDRYKKEVKNIASALTGEFGDKKNGDRSVNDIVINAIIDVSYEEDYLSHGGKNSGWTRENGHVPGSQGGRLSGKLSAWQERSRLKKNARKYEKKGYSPFAPAKNKDKINFSAYLERTEKVGKDKPKQSKAELLAKDVDKTTKELTNGIKNYARYVNNKKDRRVDTSNLSDRDLQNAIKRIELERKYSSLVNSNRSSGYERTMMILDSVGSVVGVASGVIGTAAGVYALKKGFS